MAATCCQFYFLVIGLYTREIQRVNDVHESSQEQRRPARLAMPGTAWQWKATMGLHFLLHENQEVCCCFSSFIFFSLVLTRRFFFSKKKERKQLCPPSRPRGHPGPIARHKQAAFPLRSHTLQAAGEPQAALHPTTWRSAARQTRGRPPPHNGTPLTQAWDFTSFSHVSSSVWIFFFSKWFRAFTH